MEVQTRDARRTDVSVDDLSEQFVVELKRQRVQRKRRAAADGLPGLLSPPERLHAQLQLQQKERAGPKGGPAGREDAHRGSGLTTTPPQILPT